MIPDYSSPEGPPPLPPIPSERECCNSENGTLEESLHTLHKKPLDTNYNHNLASPPPYSPEEPFSFDIPSEYVLEGVTLPEQSLGAGSYGSVVKASYHSTPVAAKYMHSAKEIKTLCKVRHPNFVQLLGIQGNKQGNSLFAIVEYVEGGSVSQLVGLLEAGTRTVSLHQKMSIFIGISRALEFLHSIPLVHRDLSSSNVLLTKELQVKVSNFGVCQPFTSQPHTLASEHHPHMAPEALRRDGVFIEEGDMFSLSIIIMELINEAHPRPNPVERKDQAQPMLSTKESEYDKRMVDVKDFNSKSPMALRGPVDHCLHDDPRMRPCAREITKELEEILESLLEEKDNALEKPSILETSQEEVAKSEMVLGNFSSKYYESVLITQNCNAHANGIQEENLSLTLGCTQDRSGSFNNDGSVQGKLYLLGDDQNRQDKSDPLGNDQNAELFGGDQITNSLGSYQCPQGRCDPLADDQHTDSFRGDQNAQGRLDQSAQGNSDPLGDDQSPQGKSDPSGGDQSVQSKSDPLGSDRSVESLADDQNAPNKYDPLGCDCSAQSKSDPLGDDRDKDAQGKSNPLGNDQNDDSFSDDQTQMHTINLSKDSPTDLSNRSTNDSPSTFLQQFTIAYERLPQRCDETQGSSAEDISETTDKYLRKPQHNPPCTEIVPKCLSNLVLQNVSELDPDLFTSRSLLHSSNYCCLYYATHIILGRFQIPCGYIDIIVVLRGNTILLFAIRITLVRLISLLQSSQQGTSQREIASTTNAVALPHTYNNTAISHGSCLFSTSVSSRHRTTVCLLPSLLILTNSGHCMYIVFLSRFRLPFGYLDTVVIRKGSTTVLVAVRVIVIGLITRVRTYQLKMLKHDTSLWIVCATKPAHIPSSLIHIYSAVYAYIFRMLSHMLCRRVLQQALPTPIPALSSSSCEIPAVESSTNTSPHSSCNDLSFLCGRSSTFAVMVMRKRNIVVTICVKRVRLISIIEFPLQLKSIMQSTSQYYQGTLFPSSESRGMATSFPALTTPKIPRCIVLATTQVPSTYNQRHICIAVYAFVFRMFSRALHCSSKSQQKTITIPNSVLALPSASISAVESSPVIAPCSSLHSYNCRGVTGDHCTYTIFFGRFKLPCGYLDVRIMLQGSVVVKSIIVFTLATQLIPLVHGRVGNALPTTGKGSLMCAQTPSMCSIVWQTQGTFNIPLCTVGQLPTSLTQLSVWAHIAPLCNTAWQILGTFMKYAMIPPSNHVAILPASSPPMQAMEPSPTALEMTTHVKNLCTGEILPTSPTQPHQNSWSSSSASCFLSTKHSMKVEQNSMATVLASPPFLWDDSCGLFLHQSMFLDLHSRSVVVPATTTTSLSPTGSHSRVWVGWNPSSSAPVPPKATVSQRLLPAFPSAVTQRNLLNEKTDSLMEQVTLSQSTSTHLNNTPRTKEESCVKSLLKYGGKCVQMGVLPSSQDTICAIAVLSSTIRQFIYAMNLRLMAPLLHNQPRKCGDRDSALQVFCFKRHLIEVCRATSPAQMYKTNISPSSPLCLTQDISKIDFSKYLLPTLQEIFPCHATDDVMGSTVRHLLPMKCVDIASHLPAVCLTPHSVGMCSTTLTQAYTLSKTHISPSKSSVCKSPAHNPPKHEYGEYLLLLDNEVHNYLSPEVLKIFIRIFELFTLGLVVGYKTREAVMHQQHPGTVSRRNTDVAQMLKHEFSPSCRQFWLTMRLEEGCFTCAWNCHEAVVRLTMWSAQSSSPYPAIVGIRIAFKRSPQPNNTINFVPEDLNMTHYCPHTPASWVHQSHYHTSGFDIKISSGLPSKKFQLDNGKNLPISHDSASVPSTILPRFPMCLLDSWAGVACKSAGIAPNHQSHMTSSDNQRALFISSHTSNFHPLLQRPHALLNQQPGSFCSQTHLGDRESNTAREVVQGSRMKKDRGDHEHAGYQREQDRFSSVGKITQSKHQEGCPTKKPNWRKKRRKKNSLCCEKADFFSTISWCTLHDHSQLPTSHMKRRYVAVTFFGRNWTRKKEHPLCVSLCSSPWRVEKIQGEMPHLLTPNSLPPLNVQSDTLSPAACTPNQRRWVCNQVSVQKAYMLFLRVVALYLPWGLADVYMHNNEGACDLRLLLAARKNSPLTHTIISLLPPPGVSRPRPAGLPLELNQPVRVVSSPQSGGSTTTTDGGSGSGRTGREESGSGPNETPGGGAGHTSPSGGGKRGGDERDDEDKNRRGRIHNGSDDKEDEMEEEGNQEEESGEEGIERESGEYSEEECLPMCCSSDRDETHRTGGTIVTPSDSSKSHKVRDKTKKGKDSDTVPPQPPPKSDQVQKPKEASHTHVDAEKQTHEELPEHEVLVHPEPSKTSHTEHEHERETSPEVDELLTEEETRDEVDSNELETSGTSVNNEPSTGQENTIHPSVELTGEPNSSSLVQEHHTHPKSQEVAGFLHSTRSNQESPDDDSVFQHKSSCTIEGQQSECNETSIRLQTATTVEDYGQWNYVATNDDIHLSDDHSCEKADSLSTISWCTLHDHSQLPTSHMKRRYVAVTFFGRNWTRKKEHPLCVSLCSSPWRVEKIQGEIPHLLAPNSLPLLNVQSDTLSPAACTPNQRRWICNEVLDRKAYMLFLRVVALYLPWGLIDIYMHNNEGACDLPLLLAARKISPLTHTIISLLPPPGVSRPRPAGLPLELNQPVHVVSSPQSGGSTTTTGGGSGSGRTAREESGGGPNETSGGGAGHTSPSGGGKRGGDERDDDDRNGRGRIHNESDDKEDKMEEECNQEEESGEDGTDAETGEYSEEECLPMCCSSDRDETHRTGGTIVTPSDSSKSHKVRDKTKKGKDSDIVPPQPPPKSDQVQHQKETSHTQVDVEEQTHEELPEHEVLVQPDPSKTSHNEHERERETSPEVDELLTEEEIRDEVDSNELETSGASVNNEPSTGLENPTYPFVEFTGEPNSSSLVQEHHTHPKSQEVAGFLHSTRSNQESPDDESVFQYKSSCTIESQQSECNETGIRLQTPATTVVDYGQLDYVATNDDIYLSDDHSFLTNPLLESMEHSSSALVASDHLFQWHLNLPPAHIPLFPLLRIKHEGNSSSSSEESQDNEPNDETLEEAIEEEGDVPATPTMAIHSLPPVVTHNNTAATICIPTQEETEKMTPHESREPDKEPYKNMPSPADPEIPGIDVTEDFEAVEPIEESPFLVSCALNSIPWFSVEGKMIKNYGGTPHNNYGVSRLMNELLSLCSLDFTKNCDRMEFNSSSPVMESHRHRVNTLSS